MNTREYITQPAESVMGIALRELKDEKRWKEILELNPHITERVGRGGREACRLPWPTDDFGPHDYFPVFSIIKLPEGA